MVGWWPKRAREHKTVPVPSIEQVESEMLRLRRSKQFVRALTSTVAVLVVVAAVAVLVATLFLPVLQVSGSSMEPTLQDSNVIVLTKSKNFKTGQLVGLRLEGKILLKRIIGVPGDWISIDHEGNVYVNHELLDEPYVTDKSLGESDISYPYQVPDNSYFVMGDHRSVSVDSRHSSVGCIPYDQIIGRVWLRIWPLPQFSVIN